MASVAYVQNPEPDEPEIHSVMRYSLSAYQHWNIWGDWALHHTFIYGAIARLDHAAFLNSFGDELLFRHGPSDIWTRLEILQRTPAELQIPTLPRQDEGRWVAALTLGYTHTIASTGDVNLGLGIAGTLDRAPEDFQPPYDGLRASGMVFLRLSGMGMWGNSMDMGSEGHHHH
jgi:hypothetical protein